MDIFSYTHLCYIRNYFESKLCKISSWWEPTFTLYLIHLLNLCVKPWDGMWWKWIVLILSFCMVCESATWNHLCLVSPARWVVSLRPRLGDEPPWFPFVFLVQVFVKELEFYHFVAIFEIHFTGYVKGLYCMNVELFFFNLCDPKRKCMFWWLS